MLRVAALLLSAALLTAACDAKDPAKTKESPPDKAAPTSAPDRPVEPPAAPEEFQVGRWSAVATPKPAALIDEEARPDKKTQADEKPPKDTPQDEKEINGVTSFPPEPLSVVLAVDRAGIVAGEARMGAHQAQLSGAYEDSEIRASFSGLRLTGTLRVARKGTEFRGEVRLSRLNRSESAEHLVPLVAELTLTKQR